MSRNFLSEAPGSLQAVEHSLNQHYFPRFPVGYLETPRGKTDLEDHLVGRLRRARTEVVPWLSETVRLRDAHLVEIGSGTGASTLAFAEQGAHVTAVDVDTASLEVARDRCKAYGVKNVAFVAANAASLPEVFKSDSFDLIVFYASLEHMTYDERIASISGSWGLLRVGGHWSIVETPNRLWYYDSHTSLLPFFHWLPDDVAVRYARRFSPRAGLRERLQESDEESLLRLIRAGRGMSYHELELALDSLDELHIVSALVSYQRRQNVMRRLYWLINERRFESMLMKASVNVPTALLHPYLDIIVRKSQEVREPADT